MMRINRWYDLKVIHNSAVDVAKAVIKYAIIDISYGIELSVKNAQKLLNNIEIT